MLFFLLKLFLHPAPPGAPIPRLQASSTGEAKRSSGACHPAVDMLFYFMPVMAMPLINCFWKMMNTMATGTMMRAAAAMVADRLLVCCEEK